MFRQQAISLILNERITTTEAKAKSLRPVVEKLITIAREDSPFHRKLVLDRLVHKVARDKLFDIVGHATKARTAATPGSISSAPAAATGPIWR
jgi:large subunit ribosomal protein L17